jgi:hypothetical protein
MMGMMGKVLPIRLDLAQPNLRKFRDGAQLNLYRRSERSETLLLSIRRSCYVLLLP